MTSQNMLDIADSLITKAKNKGADAAEIVFIKSTDSSIEVREQKIESNSYSDSSHLGIRVFVGQKVANVSSSDLSANSLDNLLNRAIESVNYVPEDQYAGLLGTDLLNKQIKNDLEICDYNVPPLDEMTKLALETEEAGLSYKGITNSEGAGCSYGKYAFGLVTSNGFSGFYEKTIFGLSCSLIAGEGTDMQTDYDYSMSVMFDKLESAQKIGLLAAKRSVERLYPKKMPSGNYPIIFDRRAGRSLLSHFASAVCGDMIARKSSFLGNCIGEQIFSKDISITDNPHIISGLGTLPFDGEGAKNDALNIVSNGIVQNLFINCASSRQLNIPSNGRASRGISGNPYCSSTNLYINNGSLSPDDLISDIKYGLYVTQTIGHGINEVTGDYSIGASGFVIENGILTYPVSEITIASNLKDMFKNMSVANDLEMLQKKNVPTIRIESMAVAGE